MEIWYSGGGTSGYHSLLYYLFNEKITLRFIPTILFTTSFPSTSLPPPSSLLLHNPNISAILSSPQCPTIPIPLLLLLQDNLLITQHRSSDPDADCISKKRADGSTTGCSWKLGFRAIVTGVGCCVTSGRGREGREGKGRRGGRRCACGSRERGNR